MTELLVRGGTVVTEDGARRADIAVAEGKVIAVEPGISGSFREVFDASGLHVFPGGVDPHVHFNEPGRTGWEGFESGSRSLVAGGITTCIEMPLNAYPPTTSVAALDAKLEAVRGKSFADYALFGGIVPGNLGDMEGMAGRGVAGFKAFMSDTGTLDFLRADDQTLYEGMVEAARLGLPVLVHAENHEMTSVLADRAVSSIRTSARDYLDSRPVVAEVEAIARAISLAKEAGCALHIVHVSTGRGAALVHEARSAGADVTCETCPHYLTFTEEDLERIGTTLKCAPPLRSVAESEDLGRRVVGGEVDFVASDHSPCPPHMKESGGDFFRAWGGISGCQSLLNATLDFGLEAGLPPERIAALISGNAAMRFRLPGKGRIEVGADADFTFVEVDAPFTLRAEDLFYRHPVSPYVGMTFQGKSVGVMLRGEVVFRDGRFVSGPQGKFLKVGEETEER